VFIKVIWVLLCLAELATIANLMIGVRITKLSQNQDDSGIKEIWPYAIAMFTIASALVSISHWIFAT